MKGATNGVKRGWVGGEENVKEKDKRGRIRTTEDLIGAFAGENHLRAHGLGRSEEEEV